MANPLSEIIAGTTSPFANNEALQRLSKVLGENLINGSPDAMVSPLVQLSIALGPIYLGVVLMILFYIGIGGLIKTATEGRFLGQQWHSFGVPAMFMLCIVLLSPVPTKNGVTLGQVVFVKGVVYGSNFADYLLKEMLSGGTNTNDTQVSMVSSYIGQVDTQLRRNLPMYVCAEQVTAMGYGIDANYFLILNDVCGVPPLMIGQYVDYFTRGNQDYVTNYNNKIKEIEGSSDSGLSLLPAMQYLSVDAIKRRTLNTPATVEIDCQIQAFKNVISVNPQYITEIEPIVGVTPMNPDKTIMPWNKKIPQQLSNNILPIDYVYLGNLWPTVIEKAYSCLKANGKITSEEVKSTLNQSNPWSGGWATAPRAVYDDLSTFKFAESHAKISFNDDLTKEINTAKLGSTLMDNRNKVILNKNMNDLKKYLTDENSVLAKRTNALKDKNAEKTQFAGGTAELVRLGVGTYATVGSAINQTAIAKDMKTEGTLLQKFLSTTVGKVSTGPTLMAGKLGQWTGLKLGQWTQSAGRLFAKIGWGVDKLVSANEAMAAGSIIGATAKLVSSAFMPSGNTLAMLSIALTVMNIVILLPQVIMLVVLLIWIVKVTIWYMIIPLATVLISLPDTRVGHSIWKSALGIILTPFLALLFFIIALLLTDAMYSSVLHWVLEPMLSAWNQGAGSFALELVKQLLTQEIIFRVFMGIAVACSMTLYLCFMIIRGPTMINNALGLHSEGIGSELDNVAQQFDPSRKMTSL